MRVSIRPVTKADTAACGLICYEAFSAIAERHRFPVDWQSKETAIQVIEARIKHAETYGVVAEVDGEVAGSAFLKTYRPVGVIGPVTVSPRIQGGHVGRAMMSHLLEHARTAGLGGTRLVQAAYNTQSMALYTKLGFQVRELLVCLHGEPIASVMRDLPVRLGTRRDVEECGRLCARLHGYARMEDLAEAVEYQTLTVLETGGAIRGYSTGVNFRGHTVAETTAEARALIAAAAELPEPGMLMPTRYGDLLRWALDHGMRITQPLTLMTRGFYQTPEGVFLPSIHG